MEGCFKLMITYHQFQPDTELVSGWDFNNIMETVMRSSIDRIFFRYYNVDRNFKVTGILIDNNGNTKLEYMILEDSMGYKRYIICIYQFIRNYNVPTSR